MAIELTDEQEAFRKVVRDFAEAEVAPHAEEWDREHRFPVATVLAMGDLGLLARLFPGVGAGGLSREEIFSLFNLDTSEGPAAGAV